MLAVTGVSLCFIGLSVGRSMVYTSLVYMVSSWEVYGFIGLAVGRSMVYISMFYRVSSWEVYGLYRYVL